MDQSRGMGNKGDSGNQSKSPRGPKATSSPRKRLKPVSLDPSNMASLVEESKESTDQTGQGKTAMELTNSGSSRLKPVSLDPSNMASLVKESKESTDQTGQGKTAMELTNSGSSNIVKNKLGDLTEVATETTRMKFIMSRVSPHKFAIPFGPRFQVKVPQWTEPVATKVELDRNDSDYKRWVENQVWTSNDVITDVSFNEIGKGRGDSCDCTAPGSSVCIERHTNEKKLKLQGEIGSVFQSWKFDEMGEAAANSWSQREQRTFKRLEYDETFWEKVQRRFSTKSRGSIVSYLFNVFIPRKLKDHAENGLGEINSDCEEIEEGNEAAKGDPIHLMPRSR